MVSLRAQRIAISFSLTAMVFVAGCFPLQTNVDRVQRIWPPADGDDSKEARSTRSVARSTPESNRTNRNGKAREVRTAAVRRLQDSDPEMTLPLNDGRLSNEQQRRLNDQLNTMMLPLGYPSSSPRVIRSTSGDDLDSSDVSLATFITESATRDGGASEQAPQTTKASTTEAAPPAPPSSVVATEQNAGHIDASPGAEPAVAVPTPSAVDVETIAAGKTEPQNTDPAGVGGSVTGDSSSNSGTPAATTPSPAIDPQKSTPGESSSHKHWRDDLQRAIHGIEQQLKEDSLSADERTRLDATLRLLYVADNRREDAVKPIEPLDADQQEFWKFSLNGFLELLNPDGPPVDGRRAKLALRHFREAVYHLGAASSLDVRNLTICRRVDSFGSYVEFEKYEFQPAQEVILYVEVGNFSVEQKDEGYETELQGSYQILDAAGRRIADYDLMLDKQICRSIRTDYFFPYLISLPKDLSSGPYRMQVTIEDKKGRKFGQTPPIEFSIR